jgi:hypothetical protein
MKNETEMSVLLELSLPPRRVKLAASQRLDLPRPIQAVPDSEEYTSEVNRRIEETRTFLSEILSTPPVWLEASRTFVAVVNASQLPILASFRWIKAIHRNVR